jgi:hypothetical protein
MLMPPPRVRTTASGSDAIFAKKRDFLPLFTGLPS